METRAEKRHKKIVKRQIEQTKNVFKVKVKYMWGWLERFWSYGAFILGNTIYLKRSLPAKAQQGLIGHDTLHILDKRVVGRVKYHVKYAINPAFRGAIEARGYVVSALVGMGQGYSREAVLRRYGYLLGSKYKLDFPPGEARGSIEAFLERYEEGNSRGIPEVYSIWKGIYDRH